MAQYDALVLGTGGVGSAALYHLARRGLRVLGLDRFPPPHDRGSSHGQTRIIRQAYFEHPDYVPLLKRSYELWEELGRQSRRPLVHLPGLLQMGPADGSIIRGVRESARRYDLLIDELTAHQIEQRWPVFTAPPKLVGVFERQAGYLMVEACVDAHVQAANRAGAELKSGVSVHGWSSDSRGIQVNTDHGTFAAERLVITAGAWAPSVLSELGLKLTVLRKPLYWYACDEPGFESASGLPAFLYDLPEGVFYGFPKIDTDGVKLGQHSGGDPVSDPLKLNREIDSADRSRVEAFAAQCLRGLSRQLTRHCVCMYTMTPDEHFVVDLHPVDKRIAIAAGLSGHGFKLTPVIGEALADLVTQGQTDLPIGFLSVSRPALRG
jgi:monomeric sarcosine oxidase